MKPETKPRPEKMVAINGLIPFSLKEDFDAYVAHRKAKKQDVLESAIRAYLAKRVSKV